MMPGVQSQLEAKLARLPGSASVQTLRAQAMAAFRGGGFPTRHQENWRYTDLKPISAGDFELVPAPPSPAAKADVAALLERSALPLFGARLVFVDGYYTGELSDTGGVDGLDLASLPADWLELEASPQEHASLESHPLASLNAAFAHHGALLRVPDGMQVAKPLQLVFSGSGGAGRAPQPRIVIDLGRGAALTVVQHFVDAPGAAGWINLVTQISQAAGSKLAFYRLQEHAGDYLHTELIKAQLAEDAILELCSIDLGGRLVRNDIDIALAGRSSRVSLAGLFLASQGQHIDNHTRIDHIAPATRSDEAFRGIIGAQGRGVFNGKVIVHPNAQGVDARQTSDNLLLSEPAEIDTKPELEIYADDVKCSHGATVGELDADQLFYLRARGVDERTARSLLTFAFAKRVLQRMDLPELRERVALRVAGNLPDHERWEELL